MIIVSNTSPLNYLLLIDLVRVLPLLYGEVCIPPKVKEELMHPGSPEVVRRWAEAPPAWIIVRAPSRVDPKLMLHAGEAEAIALAQELHVDRILMDERRGRAAAAERGIVPIGILGVLYEAAGRKLADLPNCLAKLIADTNFHCDNKIVEELLRRNALRQNKQ